MNNAIHRIHKNIRYRILSINGRHYLIDMDQPFWIFLCPFIYWLLPHKVYRIDNERTVERIKAARVASAKTGASPLAMGGISVALANVVNLILSYFDLGTPKMINIGILVVSILLFTIFRVYISKKNRNSLEREIVYEKLPIEKLRIWPTSIKHILLTFSSYLLFLFCTIVGAYAFIVEGNIFYFLMFSIMIIFFFITNVFVVSMEDFKVKFQGIDTVSNSVLTSRSETAADQLNEDTETIDDVRDETDTKKQKKGVHPFILYPAAIFSGVIVIVILNDWFNAKQLQAFKAPDHLMLIQSSGTLFYIIFVPMITIFLIACRIDGKHAVKIFGINFYTLLTTAALIIGVYLLWNSFYSYTEISHSGIEKRDGATSEVQHLTWDDVEFGGLLYDVTDDNGLDINYYLYLSDNTRINLFDAPEFFENIVETDQFITEDIYVAKPEIEKEDYPVFEDIYEPDDDSELN